MQLRVGLRVVAKRAAETIRLMLAAPAFAGFWCGAWVCGRERAFPGWSQAFGLLPGLTGVYFRRAFYRMVLPRCGADSCITFGTVFSHSTASVGRNVCVGAYCSLANVTLEDDVLIGSRVSMANGGHLDRN